MSRTWFIGLVIGAFMVLLNVNAVAATTGTPFLQGTRVTVTTPTGVIQGTLLDSKAEGWILVKEDSKANPTAIRLGESTAIRPLKNDREATAQYWRSLVRIMDNLFETKDDRSFMEKKPIEDIDFPPMSANTLRRFERSIRALGTSNVNIDAVKAGGTIADHILASATIRDFLVQGVADGIMGDYSGAIERLNRNAAKWNETQRIARAGLLAAQMSAKSAYGLNLQTPKFTKPLR